MRRAAFFAVGILVLLVLAVAGTGAWLLRDPSRFIPKIEAAATRAVGHPVHIGSLRVHPDLTIEALNVTVDNPPGRARPEMLILPRVVAGIGLFGIFSGVVDVSDIRLEHPDLVLNVADLARPPDPSPEPATGSDGGGSARLRPKIGAVTIVDGHAVVDGFPVDVSQARASHQAGGWHLTASLASRGDTAEITGTRPDAGGYAVDATGQVTLPPDPVLGNAPGRSDVTAHVGSDATRVKIQRGHRSITVATAPVASLGAPGPQPVDVSIEQPGAMLHATGHAARDGSFDAVLDGRAADLATLSPRLPAGAASIETHAAGHVAVGDFLHVTGRPVFHVALDRLALTSSAGDLSGNVTVADDVKVPLVVGTLAAKTLDMDAVLRALRAPEPQPAAAPPSAPARPSPPPPPPDPFARLREATGDVALSADALTLGGAVLHAARVHATLADGRLVLDPVAADTVAGPVHASATLDAGSAPPTIVLMLQAPSLKLTGGPITGTATIRAELNTAGETTDALLANLVGSALLAAVDGDLDPTVIAPALLEATRKLPVKVTIGPTHFRCVVVRLSALDGVATLAPITLDTPRLAASGQGTVDLRARTLALKVRPVLRSGIGLSLPLTVTGGWEAPVIGSDPHPEPVPKGDACAASLAAIGVALPLPPPAAPSASGTKPADLLRKLLR